MMLFLKRLYEFLVQAQISFGRFCTGLPFWKDVEKFSMVVAAPVRGIATLTLRLFPFLRWFEKYLELESLRRRSPVILAFSITLLAFRGILTSPNGHIGTDASVFPLLTLISCFNPFLGGLSGLVFGAADLVQKLIKPDIFGAMTWSDPNYKSALGGYVAAYSITIWMGVMPGLISRIGRNVAIAIFRRIRAKRAAAHADGATPLPFDSWSGAAGLLGSIVGAMVTAFTGVRFVAPILEWPAFHWRPTPDYSCYKSELATLKATAPRSAVMGIIGGAVAATTPPTDSPPPPPQGQSGEIPPFESGTVLSDDTVPATTNVDPDIAEAERIRQSIDQLENEVSENRRQADYYRRKLADGDPRQRDFYESQIRFYDNNASHYRDNINALKNDGIMRHTRTDLDEFNQRAEDPGIREAREKWEQSRHELDRMRREAAERERQETIDRLNEGLNREITERDVTADASRGITRDLLSLWNTATSPESWKSAWEIGFEPILDATADTAAELVHPIDSLTKIRDFYVGDIALDAQGKRVRGGIVPVLSEWAGRSSVDPVQGGRDVVNFCKEAIVKPITTIVDPNLTIEQRLLALGKLEAEIAFGEAIGALTKAGGAAANRALGLTDDAARAGTALVDDAAMAGATPYKPLGTLRREAFEEAREVFAKKAEVMEKMNSIADMKDLAAQQRALVDLKKSDPSTFNLVKKEVHPSTLSKVEGASSELNKDILGRTARELEEQGYKVEVTLAGNPGGADCDALWKITDRNGTALTEAQAGRLADSTVKGVVERDFSHLGASADDLGYKTMNGSPEKFAFNPNDAGIDTFTGKLGPDGKIKFPSGETAGTHAGKEPWKLSPGDRIGQGAMTPEGVKSLGAVLETKTEKLLKLGNKAQPADVLDAAREIIKTDIRVTSPMAGNVGATLPASYTDLLSKCRQALSGDLKTKALPPVSDWNRILQEGVSTIERNLPH